MEVYGLLASGYGDWPIIKQIAWLLGQVMNGIFNVLSKIGIENIGVCIIIFTIIIYTLMIPLTIKQQKFSKMSAGGAGDRSVSCYAAGDQENSEKIRRKERSGFNDEAAGRDQSCL